MKRSKRSSYQRLDYRLLNSTGARVIVNVSSSDSDTDHDTGSECVPGGNQFDQNLDPLLISSFESLAIQSSALVSQEAQDSHCSLPSEVSIPSGLEVSLASSGESILETSATSLSDFATPQVNSTLVFDFSHVDSDILHTTELSENSFSSGSITVTDDQILSSFSRVSAHVRGLTDLIKPASHCHLLQTSEVMSHSSATDAELTQRALGLDIDDVMEEYSASDCETTDEVDNCISKIEDLRSVYRLRHSEYSKEYKDQEQSAQKVEFEERVAKVKGYLIKLKNRKKSLRNQSVLKETEAQQQSSNFLIREIHHSISKLSKELIHHDAFSDEQITTKKAAIPHVEKKVAGVANSIKELLAQKDGTVAGEVKRITADYEDLCVLKSKYVQFIIQEAELRELSKKELFNASKLNIHLGKFSGYDSKSDIYTFQSEFTDLNQLTPKRYHARKLKNNHLEGAALALVKNV